MNRQPPDPELSAMAKVLRLLAGLDDDAGRRVLEFAVTRHGGVVDWHEQLRLDEQQTVAG